MDLKAFKGLPHEFGGIDYTEGSEVEGGEFAVNIGKSGNEYIFDKNSSEGEKLSKEFKRLDANGRLSEDDPLALEAFDQIAREEALKHAQRSVNEKGIDPFRNMYDEGGQAANGGVKYAAGGAKDMYFFGGMMGGMGSMMGGMSGGSGGSGGIGSFLGAFSGGGGDNLTGAMGTDPYMMDPLQMQNQPSRSEMSGGYELVTDGPTSYINNLTGTGRNDAINLNPQDNLSYNTPQMPSAPAPQQRLATDPMTSMPTMDSYQLPTQQTPQMPTVATDDTARTDHLLAQSNLKQEQAANAPQETKEGSGMISGIGRGLEGLIKSTNNAGAVEQQASYRSSPDDLTLSKGTKYVQPNQADYAGSAIGGFASGFETGNQMGGPVAGAVMGVIQGIAEPLMEKSRAKKQQDAADKEFKNNLAFSRIDELKTQQQNNIAQDINSGKGATDYHPGLFSKQGGALPKEKGVYGYYANGGGKKKEESYDGMKDPAQWDIMQNYIASNDTRDRMSQAAVGSGDEMYAPYRVDNTCVAGVNCFEDLAGIPSSEGMPDDVYNNRLLNEFFKSKEGKKLFRKAKNEKPGDYVQFEKRIRTIEQELPNGEIVNIPTGQFNYPFHLGMVTGDDRYLGDGSRNNPLYYSNINKEPSVQIPNLAGLDLEFNNINPNFYRMRDKKNRQKVIDAALQAKQQGKDVIRPTLGQEATGYLPLQQYRKNSQYPIAGL
jgi:hypothetical protein